MPGVNRGVGASVPSGHFLTLGEGSSCREWSSGSRAPSFFLVELVCLGRACAPALLWPSGLSVWGGACRLSVTRVHPKLGSGKRGSVA